MKLKKLLSIFMVCVMGAGAFAACGSPDPSTTANEDSHASESGQLTILKSDYKLSPEEEMARIKAEYLLQNQGYRESDEVVAILSLDGDALIDSYLQNETLSAQYSLGEYAASPAGKQKQAKIGAAQSALIGDLQAEGLIESVGYRYSTIANAISVTMTYGDFLTLEKSGYCKSVALAETYSHPQETEGTDASAIVNDVEVYETGIFKSESAKDPQGNSYTGKGTSVAVLDSGFDLSHPVFKRNPEEGTEKLSYQDVDSFIKNTKTDEGSPIHAAQTTQGLAVTDVWYSEKIPYKYDYADKDSDVFPYDSEHGTHVAGIIGGSADSYQNKDGSTAVYPNGEAIPFKGIAIDTQLVLMKVFPDLKSGAETPDILAALEDAVLLDVDAINMSLGSACGFTREEDDDEVNRIYDKINESGTSLIIAAGNEYSSGYGGAQGNTNRVTNPDSGTIGSPATYPASLSVASISGVKSKYLIGNDSQVVFFNESNSIAGEENDFFGELYDAMGWAKDGTEHTIEYVTVPGYGYRANYTGLDVKGKVALISRGDSTFEDKALQAKTAGAAACVIYNNIEGDILMSMGKSDHIPTVSISKEDGVALAKNRTGTFTLSYDQQAGPFMSDFSCWGPLPDLVLKPEITAHGGNITSSVPGGGFDTISGTSMACPNLCGLVLLIRQYINDNYKDLTGKTPPTEDTVGSEEVATYMKDVKNLTNKLLMSTAGIVLNEEGNPYSPRKQGAGLASLVNVVNTKAYIEVEKDGKVQDRSKVELGDDPTRTGEYEMTINVVNTSTSPLDYKLGVLGMTESVSTSDADFVAERDQLLGGSVQVEVLGGSGSANGTDITVGGKSGEGAAPNVLKLKVTYKLSQTDKDLIDDSFPYGMYVEGFVTLTAKAENGVNLNVPFLAFYGDWTQAPIFDKTYYEVETEAHNAGIDEEDKIKADYYATTPYGSYWYNYIIPLGTYLYTIDESMYDPIPATEDRIAISDSLGCLDGIASVYAGALRACKRVDYTITDKLTGEVIFEHIDYNAHKAFSQGGSPIPGYDAFFNFYSPDYNMSNNHMYEFKMVGSLDYGDGGKAANARNTFSFDFMFDTEAPIIKSATYEKEYDKTLKKDRYYVNVTLYDNAYAMSIQPGIYTRDNDPISSALNPNTFTPLGTGPIPLYGDKGADTTVRIEITDYLDELKNNNFIVSSSTGDSVFPFGNRLGFMVDDYALNQNMYFCALPGTEGEFAFTSDGTAEGDTVTTKTICVGEVLDLTQYLMTLDDTVDADKDYLQYLNWDSSNQAVATVEKGLVRGVKAGSSTITVYESMYGNNAQIVIRVIDRAEGQAAVAAALSEDDVPDIYDDSVTIKDIKFSYFDTLYAHAASGDASDIGMTGDRVILTAYRGGISMYPYEQIKLAYDVSPWYIKDKYQFTYKSDRPDIVTVTQDGTVQAIKEGSATITLSVSGSNLMAALRITVNSEFVIDEMRTLVAYKGFGGDVVIPDDEGILYIGPFAFSLYDTNSRYDHKLPEDNIYDNLIPSSNNSITSVKVPEGVMEIQQNAFYHCTALREVILPESIRFIRQNAFTGDTALEKINLNDEVEVIASHAFDGCTKLNDFGDGVATEDTPLRLNMCYAIGEYAFRNCTSLTNIDLTNLRNTGRYAFAGCANLANVVFQPDGLTKLSEHMFDGCKFKTLTVYEKNIVPAYAFANNKSLESVVFANGLDLIGDCAFSGDTALQYITLPDSGFALGERAFNGCTALDTVTLQKNTSITSALGSIFNGCGLKKIALAEGAEASFALHDDGKQLLNKAENELILAAVGAYTGAVTIPASVSIVRAGAFSGAKINSLTFEGPVTLGESCFADCTSLTAVTLADGANVIGNGAFAGCIRLASVENLDKVTTIGNNAFNGDRRLENVTLASGATVGDGAFQSASGLTTVTIGANSTFGASAFEGCSALATVNMPEGGNVRFGSRCFYNDSVLSTIDLSKMTGEVGDFTFYGCILLAKADLSNVTKINRYAFAHCVKLSEVIIGDDLTSIGRGAFIDYDFYIQGTSASRGPALTTIDLNNVQTIEDFAFYGCSKLESVKIPEGIKSLNNSVFGYCSSLADVDLTDVTEIGTFAFLGCSALENIDLSKVEKIGAGAFYGASALETVDLGAVKTIGSLAFADTSVTGNLTAPELTSLETSSIDRVIVSGNLTNLSESERRIPELRTVIPENEDQTGDHGKYVFTGSYAFRNANILSFDAPKLATIGDAAFSGNANLTSFNLSDAIQKIGVYVFYGCTSLENFSFGAAKATDGKINDNALLKDGVLYMVVEGGKLQLKSVPAGKNIQTLNVEEGTSVIDAYAGNANPHVTSIVLPDSLDSIGTLAFFGYKALQSVEFRSITAPRLDGSSFELADKSAGIGYTDTYGNDLGLIVEEGDPGYELLFDQYSMYLFAQMQYFNFVGLVGKAEPIKMILPQNSDISGYDNIIYKVYFGPVEEAERSDYTAMEQAMKDFLTYARKVAKLSAITLNDEALISKAVVALNSVKGNPSSFQGLIDLNEWNSLRDTVTAAREKIVRLKIDYAKKVVRDIQARIDKLPDTYKDTEVMNALILALRADIGNLELDDRNLLVQDKYTALLSAYLAAHPEASNPGGEVTPGGDENGGEGGMPVWAWVLIGVGIAVVVAGVAVTVVLLLKKKKGAPAGDTPNGEEDAEESAPDPENEPENKPESEPEADPDDEPEFKPDSEPSEENDGGASQD